MALSITSTRGASPNARRRRPTEHPWTRFLIRRGGGVLLSFGLLIVITFFIVPLLPGDPAVVAAGEGATAEQIEATRAALGLEAPLGVQFVHYVGGIFTGDMGASFATGLPVWSVVLARLPFTAEIALMAIVLTLMLGVPTGTAAALLTRGGRRPGLDHAFNAATSFVFAVPNYVLATLIVYIFAVLLGWFPASGAATLSSLVLPTAAIMIGPACALARIVRREAATILEQDYVRTARGWRLSTWKITTRYVLPNLLTTTLTLSGLILAGMLGGAVVIETVFGWPGLGTGIVTAITERDYPVIRGTILLLGIIATLLILVVDIVLALVDPRTLEAGE
ncbi:ABC transporter permease [Brevibacterium permense]|uniref:ABC transporter permease n=1 Tax=Brevibacterium permense TaxID=234834 RepID=UPI0021CE4E5E|nr:ABC transporter permease [Brevibacterium permense]MCU4298273.1 ABC transporter permease [Brevibacterium permense]